MIAAVAFCPHPPVLVPDLAQGAAAELDDLRAACRTALTRIRVVGRLVVLGSGDRSQRHDGGARGTFRGFGVALDVSLGGPDGGAIELPLSLTVGAWLIHDALPDASAEAWTVGPDWDDDWTRRLTDSVADEPVGLVAMGDGSARRSIAAPGYLDERAEPFDAKVAEAIRSGRPAGLSATVLVEATELLAAGAPVWDVVSYVTSGGTWTGELLYDEAPYGVGYFAATWT